MRSIKNFCKTIALILVSCSLQEGKAMHRDGLKNRGSHRQPKITGESKPLLAPATLDTPLLWGLYEPLALLGGAEDLRQARERFIRANADENRSRIGPLFGLRPISVAVANMSSTYLRRGALAISEACECKMMPLGIKPQETEWTQINAPAFFANRVVIFVTFAFQSADGQEKSGIVGVVLEQSLPFRNHTAKVFAGLLDEPLVIRGPGDCLEGSTDYARTYFNLVRQRATRSCSVSELGNLGIVAVVDQSVPCSRVANHTVVQVAFVDRDTLAPGLGQAPEPAVPSSAESTPPSRTTSQSGSSNE